MPGLDVFPVMTGKGWSVFFALSRRGRQCSAAGLDYARDHDYHNIQ
jgi:hypothetical protein